jgi:hypothetical protein
VNEPLSQALQIPLKWCSVRVLSNRSIAFVGKDAKNSKGTKTFHQSLCFFDRILYNNS